MTLLSDLRSLREPLQEPARLPKRPSLRVVAPDPDVRRRRFVRASTAVVSLAACAVLFATVCTHVLLTQGQADLDRLNQRVASAEASHQQLQVQVAELESPGRIVSAARQRMGMAPPATVVYLTPGAPRVSAPTTAAPTTTTPATTTPTNRASTTAVPTRSSRSSAPQGRSGPETAASTPTSAPKAAASPGER